MRLNDFLSINRWLVENKSTFVVANTSLVMTNFDRNYLEKMRKAKNISTKVYEMKIGLTKSRYYRWVNNDVDLPMELVVGIKKILGLSNYELINAMGPETEEGLNFFCGMVFSIINRLPLQKYKDELAKHDKGAAKDQPYDKISILLDLLSKYCEYKHVDEQQLNKLRQSFNLLSAYTLMDAIAVLVILNIDSGTDHTMEPLNSRLLETWVYKNITNSLFGLRNISIGVGIDLSLFFVRNHLISQAKDIIANMEEKLSKNNMLDGYSNYLFASMNDVIYGNFEEKDNAYKKMDNSKIFLPTLEFKFWKNILGRQ
ncbi:helix-turn-helix transcriptional regulator [Lactiplantibacillus plantarum]|uniref:helix-turn-helix domain-containing protein n=1 Tax=Lactiplantibacillus plantarum TaxID=1590 RepID=UPI003965CBB5